MGNLRGKIQSLTLALVVLALTATGQTIDSMVANVSGAAIFSTIAGLQAFGTRSFSAGNNKEISTWLRSRFNAEGLTDVAFDPFIYSSTALSNVVATIQGIQHPDKEIVVGGHFDSVPAGPGADDDASGTAAVLEIARVIAASGYRPSATIRFVAFMAEEAGLVGSGHYAADAKSDGRDIIMMINFDMIAYTSSANSGNRVYVDQYVSGPGLATLASSAATTYTSLTPVITTQYSTSVDANSFAARGYPAVNFIEYVFNPYYHSASDLIGKLDSSYACDITRAGLATILLLDQQLAASVPPAATVPTGTALSQNYPNPFNPATRIQYTVGVASGKGQVASVKLLVYDLLGREVAVLVNEQKAPGSYEVSFDGSGLASGVYLYRLTAGAFVQSRTMLLLK